jgi:hypothetical protein
VKATIHTELRCGSCGQMLQYHEDIKVRCVNLKCSERGNEYLAPAIELKSEQEQEKPKRGRPKAAKD